MKASRPFSILVPVLGGDISTAVFAEAKATLERGDCALVVLHVEAHPAADAVVAHHRTSLPADDGDSPRWAKLAAQASRVFVDAIAGDPATVIVRQAARFHSDMIIIGTPDARNEGEEWIDRVVSVVARTAPARVRVANWRPLRPLRPPPSVAASGSQVRALQEVTC